MTLIRYYTNIMKDTNAKLYVKPDCNSNFCKPRSAPHALKGGIEEELTQLGNLGALEKLKEPSKKCY